MPNDLYVLDRKRNIDLQVILFALKRNFLVTKKNWPGKRDYGKFSARLAGIRHRDTGIPGGRAEIFSVFNRRAEILANRASAANLASQPHVVGS